MSESPLEARTLFEGRFVQVDSEDWPGGSYEVVRRVGAARAGAAAVVALTPAAEVVMVRVFRQPVRQALLEIPAGLLDREGEDPIECASRELLEETGYRAAEIEFLAGYYPTPGLSDEYVHLFLARAEAEPAGTPDGEASEVVVMPFERALDSARSGRVRDSKTAIGLMLAGYRLASG